MFLGYSETLDAWDLIIATHKQTCRIGKERIIYLPNEPSIHINQYEERRVFQVRQTPSQHQIIVSQVGCLLQTLIFRWRRDQYCQGILCRKNNTKGEIYTFIIYFHNNSLHTFEWFQQFNSITINRVNLFVVIKLELSFAPQDASVALIISLALLSHTHSDTPIEGQPINQSRQCVTGFIISRRHPPTMNIVRIFAMRAIVWER